MRTQARIVPKATINLGETYLFVPAPPRVGSKLSCEQTGILDDRRSMNWDQSGWLMMPRTVFINIRWPRRVSSLTKLKAAEVCGPRSIKGWAKVLTVSRSSHGPEIT